MSGNGPFGFCRSCGSANIKIAKDDGQGNKEWQCEDCNVTWKQIRYESKQDESEFITSDLKDGSAIIH